MWRQVIEKMMRTGSHLSSHNNIAISFPQEIQVVYFCLTAGRRARAFLFPSIERQIVKGKGKGWKRLKLPEDLRIMGHPQH